METHDKTGTQDHKTHGQDNDPLRRLGHLEHSERHVEHRLTELEKSVADLRNVNLESHKWLMTTLLTLMAVIVTVVFGGAGVLLVIIQNQAREDLHTELKDMQGKVDSSIKQMNDEFQELAGDALKKPLLTIANSAGPLNGQTLKFTFVQFQNCGYIPICPLYIKNVGDKRSGAVELKLYCTQNIGVIGSDFLQGLPSNDPNFPYCYKFNLNSENDAYPQDTITIEKNTPLSFAPPGLKTNIVSCRIFAFCDAEKPAEADFQIKLH
jgi:hypothetical protein